MSGIRKGKTLANDDLTGLVLAGGRATRMGGADKGLIAVAGRPMAAHVLDALKPQTGHLLINANRHAADYQALGAPVIADAVATDTVEQFAGPLAGMLSGLHAISTPWMVTAPCDSPLVPDDLVARLWEALQRDGAELAVAWCAGRMQPVFALLHKDLLPSLDAYLHGGERKIDRWFASHRTALADFSHAPDTFLNINTPEERDALEAKLAKLPPGAASRAQ